MTFSAAMSSTKTKNQLLLLLALWAATFYPVWPDLIGAWFEHSNNSHGVLVPFVFLYFVWLKTRRINC